MKRALVIIAAVALGVALVAIAAYGWLFSSPQGRGAIESRLEAEIGEIFGGEAEIGALQGALPARIVLNDIRIRDADGEWLLIPRTTVVWRPFALFRKKIIIEDVSIDGARLSRATRRKDDVSERPRGFELPDQLPFIVIDALSVNDLEVAAPNGKAVRIDGAGVVRMGGRTLFIRINANSDDERDSIAALIERSGEALASDVTIVSADNGALSTLLGLDGALFVEAKGGGPLNDYRLALNARLGAYGALNGALTGDLKKLDRLTLVADAELGERLSNTARIIGEKANISVAFAPSEGGGALEIGRFKSEIVDIDGRARWRNRGGALAIVEIDMRAALADGWRPELRRYLGDAIAVKGEIKPQNGAYLASGRVTASLVGGAIENAETDLRDYIRGRADLTLKENGALPPAFKKGASASGAFDVAFDGAVKATPIELETIEGLFFKGDASYVFDSEAFTVKGDATLTPSLAAAASSNVQLSRNLTAALDLAGVPDDFGGRIIATTPAARVQGAVLPPMRATLAATGMPSNSKGQLTARAVDGSRRLNANFVQTISDAWRIGGLDYVGREFALKGGGAYDPKTGEGAVDLAYRGREGAEPLPGFLLVGDFTAKGALRRGENNRIEIKSSMLASERWASQGLTATATGSPDRLHVAATAGEASVNALAPVTDISAALAIEPRNGPLISLNKFDAKIGGAPFKTSRAALIDLGDGVRVENFRAAAGRKGSIAFDGAFNDARWRGKLAARAAPIVSAASVIDLNLDLDTDRRQPAAGDFMLTSQLTKAQTASLSGAFTWDGARLRIVDSGDESAFNLDLKLPVRLVRGPALSVDVSGALAGTARYNGRVETVAGFLPATLQTLEGELAVQGRASGTLDDPKLSGSLTVRNGAFTELSTGLSIVNIDATARANAAATGSRIEFDAAGGGVSQTEKSITAKGVVTIAGETRLASKFTMDNARLSAGPVSEVTASGEIDVSGPFSDLLAKGAFNVSNLDAQVFTPESTGLVDINVVAVNGDGEPAPSAERTAPPPSIRYDIAVKGDDRIYIRGRGLESEWRADVNISGRADDPAIVGEMRLRKGDIAFSGRRFDMTRGAVTFDRLSLNNPILDMRAERETRSGVVAAIVIAGRAASPKISLESSPTLPPEDIMALILFDKPANELSAIESLQVAEGLASLGGIGPFGGDGLTGSARRALGLDLLSVDIDQADSAASSLTVGKYVADGLFVSATQDARGQNGSVRIEYEIDDSFTVETELRQDGDQTVSANWKHDF